MSACSSDTAIMRHLASELLESIAQRTKSAVNCSHAPLEAQVRGQLPPRWALTPSRPSGAYEPNRSASQTMADQALM